MHMIYAYETRSACAADPCPARGLRAGLAAVCALLASPGAAQDLFSLPQGCTAFLTVQSADCSVDHHFTCTADPAGEKQRVSLDEQGMTYLGSTDEETQWVRSYHPLAGHSERLAPDPADPASLTRLLSTGVDSYDFVTLSDEVGPTRYVGQDSLTGSRVVIDGVELRETAYSIRALASDGSELWRAQGNEYVSERFRSFFAGTSVVTTPGDRFERDGRPVEFIFPGEPGFLSANPKHGCGVVMSRLELLP